MLIFKELQLLKPSLEHLVSVLWTDEKSPGKDLFKDAAGREEHLFGKYEKKYLKFTTQ